MTVTATQTGTAAKNGTGLAVRVLIGAKPPAQQTGATASGNTTALNATITPQAAGSQVYTAIVSYAGASAFTWENGETSIYNTPDAVTGQSPGFARLTSLTPDTGSITAGAASGAGANYHLAIAEILGVTSASLAEHASTPAPAYTATATAVTSPAFAPPAGALLVALALANTTASGTQGMTISDTSGLTWKQLVINPGSFPNTGVWVAQARASSLVPLLGSL